MSMDHDCLLITFGCSWTYGVGIGYQEGMSHGTYNNVSRNTPEEVCDRLSFRGILSKKYNFKNINFSVGGSSNQQQFRLARQFFVSDEWRRLRMECPDVIVLWGITSTARNELYNTESKEVQRLFYTDGKNNLAKSMLLYGYNHEWEIQLLAIEMRFWDRYFAEKGIKNIWFDTFNHHHYPRVIKTPELLEDNPKALRQVYKQTKESLDTGNVWPTWDEYLEWNFDSLPVEVVDQLTNPHWDFARVAMNNRFDNNQMLFEDSTPRDLLSRLCIDKGFADVDDQYHYSEWSIDSNRVQFLTDEKLLNPWTYHPTQSGHCAIADILDPAIQKLLP